MRKRNFQEKINKVLFKHKETKLNIPSHYAIVNIHMSLRQNGSMIFLFFELCSNEYFSYCEVER